MNLKYLHLRGLIILSLIFLFVSCEKDNENIKGNEAFGLKEAHLSCTETATLWAGQHMDAGSVVVTEYETQLIVEYLVGPGWLLLETHLYVGPEQDIPATKSGNPKIGKFPYSNTSGYYTIDKDPEWGSCFVIAAHAVVEADPAHSLAQGLPELASLIVEYPGGDSYLNADIFGETSIDGIYDDFCVDIGHGIRVGKKYTVNVYSSYETLPSGVNIVHPENLDLVNWIINQQFYGQQSPGGYGTYNATDIQRAIWEVIDDPAPPHPSWDPSKAEEITAAAYANGGGFVPTCGDLIAIILDPVGIEQVTIAIMEYSALTTCGSGEETAWGKGANYVSFTGSPYYGGSRWGWYFANCSCTQPLPW